MLKRNKNFNVAFKVFSFLFSIVVLLSWNGNANAGDRKLIKVDGSSTVFPITEAVAEEFQILNRKIMVTVGISGTGGGFKKFSRGEIDISDASRPIKSKEVDFCKEGGIEFVELPVAYDGLAVMVNTKNDWVDYLTVKELKRCGNQQHRKRSRNGIRLDPNGQIRKYISMVLVLIPEHLIILQRQ